MNTEEPKEDTDLLRKMCVRQGYVPPKCTLPGPIAFGLVQRGEDPCAGCTEDRAICGGRPRSSYTE